MGTSQVASLKGYGMTTFYFMMGIYVHLNGEFFRTNFGFSVLVSFINVVMTPIIIVMFSWLCGVKARTAIYTSLLSNSLGETTLTLQVLSPAPALFSVHPKLSVINL
jgi:hypothetical protein